LEINERFHVTIPLAGVYTYLYELEKNEILTTTLRGNSRIYYPTKEGVVYIKERLK
jgi:DNA-binding PadR family transcriptional regulator